MITMTDRAVAELKRAIAEEKVSDIYVRVGVKGGGCSGFQYTLTLDEGYDEGKDTVYDEQGLKVVIDKRSAMYIEGTKLDYIEDLNKRGFKFDNPQSKGTCGCGSSFSM